jgi:hypothetical protein
MRDLEFINCVLSVKGTPEAPLHPEAEAALDRVLMQLYMDLIEEHTSRSGWNESQATMYERSLAEIEEKYKDD